MSKQKILNQLAELLNIPQIERLLHHKLEELQLLFGDEISYYRQIKDRFKKSVYGNLKVLDSEDEAEKQARYHFELNSTIFTTTGDPTWLITCVEPAPPLGCHDHDIVPEVLIRHMSSFNVNPGHVETLADFTLPGLDGKRFDLEFTVFSQQHILGNIKHHAPWELALSEERDGKESDRDTDIIYYCDSPAADDESNIKELLYYINKYPAVKSYFFSELDMIMKPLIHGNMVEVNVDSRPVDLF